MTHPRFEVAPGLRVERETSGSGVVIRRDGRRWRLSPDSVALLEFVRAGMDTQAIAHALTERMGRPVDEPTARTLVLTTLAEPGLIQHPDARDGAHARGASAPRTFTILPAGPVRAIARALAPLARSGGAEITAVAVAVAALALVPGARLTEPDAWRDPGAWILALLLSVASFLAHELGHAAAALAGGARPGAIRVRAVPVLTRFQCELHGVEALARAARVRLDLAGVVAQGAFLAAALGLARLAGLPATGPAFALPFVITLRQLVPTRGSDGEWWLVDAAGAARTAFAWPPATPTRAGRAWMLGHAWLGAAVSTALAALALRLAMRSTAGPWVAGGAALTAIAFGAAAVTFVLRTIREPRESGTLLRLVSPARWLDRLVRGLQARAAILARRTPFAGAEPLLANLLVDVHPGLDAAARRGLVRRFAVAEWLTAADHRDLARGGRTDEIRNTGPVRALVAGRQGAVVCAVHLGPYFYPVEALTSLGASVLAFSAAHVRAQRGSEWESARSRAGADFETVVAGDPAGLLRARRALRDGRLVFLLIDGQNAAREGDAHRTLVPMGAGEAWVRTAAAEMAARARVPLLLAACWREGLARRIVQFSDLVPPPATADAESVAAATRAIHAWFEPFARAHPEQMQSWMVPFLQWREMGRAPTATREALERSIERNRDWLVRGTGRLVTDPERVAWMAMDGERYIVHGERRRVLAGDPLACALLDEAVKGRRLRDLPARVAASHDVIAAMLARLELAELARIEPD